MIVITALPMKVCYRVSIPVRWWVADMGTRSLTEIKIFTLLISECFLSNQQVSKSCSEIIFTYNPNNIKLNIMSLKYSMTTADYLVWSDAMNLTRKLAKDGNYKISLLVAIGCFTGLWISDILALRWKQILNTDEFTVIEKKTGKQRIIRINPQLQQHIKECYEHINPVGVNAPILISQKGTVFTVQRINIILKEVKTLYNLRIKNFSCHSFRKTFGRQVYTMNGENSELALVKLMELFNHSSVAITKRYLGLRQEEILQTYDCLAF